MTTQEIVAFVRRGYDAYNAHQSDPHWLDYATEDVAEDGEVVDIPSGMIFRGPDGLKQFLLGFSTAFPDSRVEVTNVFATEEHAVVEFIGRGTFTGALLEISRQPVGSSRCASAMCTNSGTGKLSDTPPTMMHSVSCNSLA